MQNEVVNPDKEIYFGDNVWIGCRCTTMKGSYIGDNIIVGSNSTITGRHTQEFTVLAGNPIRIVKEGVKRDK
jgi:acetyltransferase-like isoleucine patch superfamily enzyme